MRLWRPHGYACPGRVALGRGGRAWVRPVAVVHTGRAWTAQPTRPYYFAGGPVGLFVFTRDTSRAGRAKFAARRRKRR
jgi:hypothetical protein